MRAFKFSSWLHRVSVALGAVALIAGLSAAHAETQGGNLYFKLTTYTPTCTPAADITVNPSINETVLNGLAPGERPPQTTMASGTISVTCSPTGTSGAQAYNPNATFVFPSNMQDASTGSLFKTDTADVGAFVESKQAPVAGGTPTNGWYQIVANGNANQLSVQVPVTQTDGKATLDVNAGITRNSSNLISRGGTVTSDLVVQIAYP